MNIEDLKRENAEAIQRNNEREARLRSEAETILADVERAGRDHLSTREDMRWNGIMSDIEKCGASGRRLAMRQVEIERTSDEMSDMDTRMQNATVPAGLPKRDNRIASVHVTRNERTYRPDTDPNGVSFLKDVVSSSLRGDPLASDRLVRHMSEERVERPGVDPMRQERAAGDATTTNFTGLVVPQYLTEMVANQVSALRPFADLCTVKHDLPPSGMSVNFSKITTGSSVALQATELTGISATSIDDTLGTAPVLTAAGQQTISRQAMDRGTGVEQTTFLDLSRKYATTLDSTILNQATTGVSAIAQNVDYADATPTAAELWPFLEQADSKLETALMGVSFPTHVVMHSRRWHYLAAQVGSTWPFIGSNQVNAQQGGMVLTSEYGPSVRAKLNSGLLVVVDNNITTTGTTGGGTNEDEIYVVASGESVHLWEDPNAPVYIRAEQPAATSLGVLLVLYGYFAYATRYANAVSKVTGTGMNAPAGF